MEFVVIVVEVNNRNSVGSGRQAEVLVHVYPEIPSKLDAIIPDLHLAYWY